jgi:hypothetical protein
MEKMEMKRKGSKKLFMQVAEINVQGMEELSAEQASAIIGGESLWFWVGYAVGATVNMINHVTGG